MGIDSWHDSALLVYIISQLNDQHVGWVWFTRLQLIIKAMHCCKTLCFCLESSMDALKCDRTNALPVLQSLPALLPCTGLQTTETTEHSLHWKEFTDIGVLAGVVDQTHIHVVCTSLCEQGSPTSQYCPCQLLGHSHTSGSMHVPPL